MNDCHENEEQQLPAQPLYRGPVTLFVGNFCSSPVDRNSGCVVLGTRQMDEPFRAWVLLASLSSQAIVCAACYPSALSIAITMSKGAQKQVPSKTASKDRSAEHSTKQHTLLSINAKNRRVYCWPQVRSRAPNRVDLPCGAC